MTPESLETDGDFGGHAFTGSAARSLTLHLGVLRHEEEKPTHRAGRRVSSGQEQIPDTDDQVFLVESAVWLHICLQKAHNVAAA